MKFDIVIIYLYKLNLISDPLEIIVFFHLSTFSTDPAFPSIYTVHNDIEILHTFQLRSIIKITVTKISFISWQPRFISHIWSRGYIDNLALLIKEISFISWQSCEKFTSLFFSFSHFLLISHYDIMTKRNNKEIEIETGIYVTLP